MFRFFLLSEEIACMTVFCVKCFLRYVIQIMWGKINRFCMAIFYFLISSYSRDRYAVGPPFNFFYSRCRQKAGNINTIIMTIPIMDDGRQIAQELHLEYWY